MCRTADRGRHRRSGALAARWLAEPAKDDRPTAPITTLSLHPVEVVSAAALQLPLWGSSGDDDRLRARRALVRVQGLLGPEAVQVPVLSGGRGPAERITFTPLGDEPVPRADPSQPWPGQLPEPSPTVLLDDPIELLDADGNPVRVTSRGLFSADPARLASGSVASPGLTRKQGTSPSPSPAAGSYPLPVGAGEAELVGWTVARRRKVVGSRGSGGWERSDPGNGPGYERTDGQGAGAARRRRSGHAAVLPATEVVPGGGVRVVSASGRRTDPPAR